MPPKKFQVLDDIDHLLQRPQTYVGSVINTFQDGWVYDNASEKMVFKQKIKYNEGLVKIINEAIDNCIDNSFIEENPTTMIKVELDKESVVIKNNGAGIPIEKKAFGKNNESQYIPEVIFGSMRSGSNFNETREGIGMNGVGIKAANILSKEFTVTCCTGDKKYTQTWSNNMRNKIKPKIVTVKNTPTYSTVVRFKPDLEYFNKADGEFKLESVEELADVVYSRLLTLSVSHPNPIKVYFGSQLIKCKDLKNYMKLFTKERTFYDTVPGTNFEYGITLSTSGVFEHQSFVNCQPTKSDKSTHTKYVTNKVVTAISTHLKKKGLAVRLSNAQISNYLFVFVNARIKNPTFTSQTKVELSTPVNFPMSMNNILGLVKKSGLMNKLEEQLSTKALTTAQKSLNASSKSSSISIPKLDDAHNAGTSKSLDTTLFLVEGDSAKTMVSAGQSVIGRKNYGVFPLKGKLLNVIGASPKKLADNKEIANIMKIVGLNFSKKYDTDAEFKTLRYGQVCVLTDADVDGVHILGLIVTFFNHFWPALLSRPGFLTRFVTPLLKVSVSNTRSPLYFFTNLQYEEWKTQNPNKNHRVTHLKGLGTSLRSDTIMYFQNMVQKHLKTFTFDSDTSSLVKHVFDPKDSNWRKEWLLASCDDIRLDYTSKQMSLSTFLKTEMYDFSSYNIKRAIPSAIDGLKTSQRKTIYYCLKKFSSPSIPPFKVAQLAAATAADTQYAHGEVSLQGTIINMGQNFPGSNNIPLLTADGAFGSRMANGNDAASPRYIFTRITNDCRTIFDIRSDQVLNYLEEENEKVEPEFYVPQLPLALINGVNGIATGFRTLIPAFNPDDIIFNIKAKINGDQPRNLKPFYKGSYKTNHLTTFDNNSWTFKGLIKFSDDKKTATIEELPIGIAIDDYKDKVLSDLVQKGLIKKFVVDHKSENEPKFVIYSNGKDALEKLDFKLTNTFSSRCMNLLDNNGIVKNFETPQDILDYWYVHRRQYLEMDKTATLCDWKKELEKLNNKAKFIQLIVDGQLTIQKKSKDMLVRELDKYKLVDHDSLLSIPIMSITEERVKALAHEIKCLCFKIGSLERKSIDDIIMSQFNTKISNKRPNCLIDSGQNKKQKC